MKAIPGTLFYAQFFGRWRARITSYAHEAIFSFFLFIFVQLYWKLRMK